ncbi:MAG TPA: phosphatidate cytidylyltransferase [Acidimicrobiales bacterium]|nr:phosphatidate cytidylyltransferase [Acidimicrobiales bacterium]
MSDDTGSRKGRQPAEGVRIIRAEEAQAALDAGEAAGRRPDDQPRFGDVPPAPSGPRPAHRFPLPDSVDPAEAVSLSPLSARRAGARYTPPGQEPDPTTSGDDMEHEAPPWAASSSWREAVSDSTTEMDPTSPSHSGFTPPSRTEIPDEGITVTGSVPEMPHWSDPPTGEVPRLRFDVDENESEDDMKAWQALGSKGVRWRDDDGWDEEDELSDLMAPDEERSGALDPTRTEHSDLYSFDEDFERVAANRTGSHPVVDLTGVEDPEVEADDTEWAAPPAPARRARARTSKGTRSGAGLRETGPVAEVTPPPVEEPVVVGAAAAAPTVATARRRPTEADSAGTGARRRGATSGPSGPSRPGGPGRRNTQNDRDDLMSRVVIGGGLILLLIIASIIGPKALIVLSAIVVVAAAGEAYNMTRAPGFRPATLLGLVATVGCVLGAYWKGIGAIPVVTVLLFAGAMLWYVLGVVEARPLANVAVTVMVFVWVSVLGSFSAVLLSMAHGEGLFLGAVLVAVAADISAFGVGRSIGSRPLAAEISPSKTVEGFIGGIVGSLIVGAIIGKELAPWGGMKHGLLLGLIIGLIAPVGDLFESMLKRDLGLKDSGSVLGGHGGFLDRFDGILLALPAAYFVATIGHIH